MIQARFVLSLLVVAMVGAGCATTNVTTDPSSQGSRRLAKPDRIVVYSFATTTADLPPEEQGAYADPTTAPTADQVQAARELGDKVAERLVDEINDMGMRAVVGTRSTPLSVGDIVIRGHFESIDEGSATKRMVVGFGSGKAEMTTVVAGYVVTSQGLRRVGGGTVDSAGGKGPGLFVPVIVTAATANPIGLIVAGAAKVEGQVSGRTTIDGAAKRTADAIAERMKDRFEDEGWI